MKIGILTMHKIYNYGSSLQAYALQKSIIGMGYECNIIDYKYPNSYHSTKKRKLTLKKILKGITFRIKMNLLYKRKEQKKLFHHFWEEYYHLTKTYNSRTEIFENPPEFDLYVTGSDQVWNPRHMKGDSVFFCDFIKNGKHRISYAASFSSANLDVAYREMYTNFLSKYFAIGVREESGVNIVKQLIGADAKCVCDPTLLLTAADYIPLANHSSIHIERPYILAYILSYNYNPYPLIQQVINKVSKETKMSVVYLLCNNLDGFKGGDSLTISAAGPNEFIYLFKNASYVITSSFHGTAFSLIFEKDFYAITSGSASDDRIVSLLNKVKLKSRSFEMKSELREFDLEKIDYSKITPELNKYRDGSLQYLKQVICNSVKNENS